MTNTSHVVSSISARASTSDSAFLDMLIPDLIQSNLTLWEEAQVPISPISALSKAELTRNGVFLPNFYYLILFRSLVKQLKLPSQTDRWLHRFLKLLVTVFAIFFIALSRFIYRR